VDTDLIEPCEEATAVSVEISGSIRSLPMRLTVRGWVPTSK
jgi:hypothetical protein